MVQYLVIIGVVILMFLGLAASLTFARYKKRDSACCGGGHCRTPQGVPPDHNCCGKNE